MPSSLLPSCLSPTSFWHAHLTSLTLLRSHTQNGDEYVQLLSGSMTLANAEASITYNAPDVFVIPNGWTGTWDVTKTVKKFFVLTGSD